MMMTMARAGGDWMDLYTCHEHDGMRTCPAFPPVLKIQLEGSRSNERSEIGTKLELMVTVGEAGYLREETTVKMVQGRRQHQHQN